MKIKRIVSSAVMGILLVTTGSLAWAEEEDEKDLSAYQWGYWDKMVSPAAGPLAPVGDIASAPLPPPPQPTPDPIPPTPDPEPRPIPGWSTNESPDTKPLPGPTGGASGGGNGTGNSDGPPPPPPPPPLASPR